VRTRESCVQSGRICLDSSSKLELNDGRTDLHDVDPEVWAQVKRYATFVLKGNLELLQTSYTLQPSNITRSLGRRWESSI
jgi:hypothetical protein